MAKEPAKAAPKEGKTVPMVRSEEYPKPHSADVHPSEVENFKAGGWVEA